MSIMRVYGTGADSRYMCEVKVERLGIMFKYSSTGCHNAMWLFPSE